MFYIQAQDLLFTLRPQYFTVVIKEHNTDLK